MTTTVSPLVSPGTIRDTTGDRSWSPVRVTAILAQPVAGLPKDPMHLDGPLAWCAYLQAQHQMGDTLRLPPMRQFAHDFTLPLATWTTPATRPDPDPRMLAADGTMWGWACSMAHYTVLRHDLAWIRRKPALGEMAYWTTANRHHLGLGPRRAANTPHQAAWVDSLTWWALADMDQLRRLLDRLTHVGRAARHGWGQITSVTVTPDPSAVTRWRCRHLPHPGRSPQTVRAPYHHPSRRMPAQVGAPCH